jgi:hypothetical protein
MQLLYPGFLYALLVLAIPVLIHLFHFRRFKKVYFSNVQFLKTIQQQQASGKLLKHRLILLSRLSALLFLVLAFARPYIPLAKNQKLQQLTRVSIFIDNSYSMQLQNADGILLDEAKRKAKEIVSTYQLNDRFQLLTQDFEGKHQRFVDRDEFKELVDEVKISPHSRTIEEITSRQDAVFQQNSVDKKAVYIISDFQQNLFTSVKMRSDSTSSIHLVKLDAGRISNVSIDSVWFLAAIHQPGQEEKLVVKWQNHSDEAVESVPIKLFINGQQKAIATLNIGPRALKEDTLRFSGLKAGWQQGYLEIKDQPIIFDNTFYFSFQVLKQMEILNINGGIANPYLKAVFTADEFFKPIDVTEGNVNYTALPAYPLITLSDVNSISEGLGQHLKNYLEQGGNLMIFPAANADIPSYQRFLISIKAGFPTKLVKEESKVKALNLQSPVFKDVFDHFPQQPDLPKVLQYFDLKQNAGVNSESIMAIAAGQAFFSTYRTGNGRVYLSAVPLDESFSNLPRHALFVPLIFRIALLSGVNEPLFYMLGKDEVLTLKQLDLSSPELISLQKQDLRIIPDVRNIGGRSLLYIGDQVREIGNYRLIRQDSLLAMAAFNDNRRESDLRYMTSDSLSEFFKEMQHQVFQPDKISMKEVLSDENFGIQLWKLCLILTLIFLAVEVLLIRFYHPQTQS